MNLMNKGLATVALGLVAFVMATVPADARPLAQTESQSAKATQRLVHRQQGVIRKLRLRANAQQAQINALSKKVAGLVAAQASQGARSDQIAATANGAVDGVARIDERLSGADTRLTAKFAELTTWILSLNEKVSLFHPSR